MNSTEYRALLAALPIENPTPDDMARLCPHLTPNQAVEAFLSDSGYVACPPLRVRHGFQIVSYFKEWVEELKEWQSQVRVVVGTKVHPAQLAWSYAGRTPASYAGEISHSCTPYRYSQEANAFAEANWGDELVLDTWMDVMEIFIQDPTELVASTLVNQSPRTVMVLGIALSRKYNEISNDNSKPYSELFDDAIVEMTTERAVWQELKGGRGGFTNYNCAHCAAGLGLSSCHGCGHTFEDNAFRCGWDMPLSRKMVAYLQQQGHVFAVDPEIAWAKEQSEYAKYMAQSGRS